MANIGDLLRLARQLRGFTQKQAAPMLGVPQTVLSRLENDLITADASLIEKAGAAYSLPPEFFYASETVYGPPVSVHAMLRGKADVSAREVDMITAELNIRLMHLRRFLENVDFQPNLDLPNLDIEQYESPEKVAATLRAHWKVTSGPIKNLTRLLERAGVVIGLSHFNGSAVSGVTYKAPGNPPIILLNADHPSDRVRFTLAHELGHLVMHRFPTPGMEDEANKFASAFLLPPNEMKQLFRARKVTLEFLAAQKKEWRVSMQALLMAAQSCDQLLPNQARYLWQQISKRGWRTREPAELDFEMEKPEVLPTIIKSHITDLNFQKSELIKMSKVYENDFVNYYGDLDQTNPTRPRLRIVN